MVSWLREGREKREREQRRGAFKTLTSNLVYCVKKSHIHSRPRGGPHAPVWPWWTLAPGLVPCPSRVRAELLLLLLGRWRDRQPVCWSLCGGRWVDSRMTGERTPKCLISKKIAVYTPLFVLVQYKQNKKSLL